MSCLLVLPAAAILCPAKKDISAVVLRVYGQAGAGEMTSSGNLTLFWPLRSRRCRLQAVPGRAREKPGSRVHSRVRRAATQEAGPPGTSRHSSTPRKPRPPARLAGPKRSGGTSMYGNTPNYERSQRQDASRRNMLYSNPSRVSLSTPWLHFGRGGIVQDHRTIRVSSQSECTSLPCPDWNQTRPLNPAAPRPPVSAARGRV